MLRHKYARRMVLLLMVLAVAFLWAADQGIRAAGGGRAEKVAAPAVGTDVSATAATPASATPAKATTAAATTAPAGPQPGQGKRQTATACTVNGKVIDPCPPGIRKQTLRQAARQNAAGQTKGVAVQFAGVSSATATISPLAQVGTGPTQLATMATVVGPVDYFGVGNWANSPLPTVTNGVISGGIPKFVDQLGSIPLAVADRTTFPGDDFYKIGLKEYTHVFSSAMPLGANIRGYYDKSAGTNNYLGPLILSVRGRATRVLFSNELTTDLTIPVDTTYMGAGMVNDGTNSAMASQRRASVHLHGGNTPWISDGTVHQWTTPLGGDGQPAVVGFAKGWSTRDVPDMVPPLCVGAQCVNPTPSLTDGMETFYWTNQQSGRLMFFHDHAYGITRLNVYDGEAAGYLIADPVQENALKAATVPGTIATMPDPTPGAPAGSLIPDVANSDLTHMYPLVIQDKTFVPDPATQLAAQDPTWDTAGWGGFGSLWFPHVYSPNQNPADLTGANGFGRYDWGPWFWPPQDPKTLVLQPYPCPSAAVPTGGNWAFPPLLCPGVPDPTQPAPGNSPSSTPEAFMDTPVVNGVAYPTLPVAPAAYRFQVLNASNDRTLNLGLYVADPLTISVAAGGSGYLPLPALPPAVVVGNCTATATAYVDLTGAVSSIAVAPGAVCTGTPSVTIDAPPAGGTQAYAVASTNTDVRMVPAIPAASGRALPNCGVSSALTLWGGGLVTSALTTPTGLPSDANGVPNCWPEYYSPTGFTAGSFGESGVLSWGNSDARTGGVPDPTLAGPPIIQIGAEGGLLPNAAVIPSTPVSYDYNKRSITVLNVLNHGLLLGPAERADIIVDFTQFAGKTLIVYNDAPAPVPAGDPRLDYYTNDPDQSSTGGAPTTMAGYGPNMRTIMQITVNGPANPNSTTFAPATLQAALPALFASTQDPVIVPESVYPAANGYGPDTYVPIQNTSVTFPIPNASAGFLSAVTLTNPGSGYTAVPAVTISGGGGTGATAAATLGGLYVSGATVTSGGAGYTSAPSVSFSGGGGTGATATANMSGSVASVAVTSGGGGYTTAPSVVFNGGGGTGAAATASISGTVSSVTVTNPGVSYTSAPAVAFSGGGGTGATATARITGGVGAVVVTNAGSGYRSAPTISFSGGGGTGAAATATIKSNKIFSITVTNPGSGYTSAPTVTISGGGGKGGAATASISGTVTSITVTSGGTGYSSAPTVSLSGGGGTGATAAAAISSGVVAVTVTAGGTGYTSAPTVSFTGGIGTGAAATANVLSIVASVNVTNGGSNYTSTPTVVFTGGGGSGAAATASVVPGFVSTLALTAPGTGYTSTPTVAIAPPPSGTTATANATLATTAGTQTLPLLPKAIQELFTLDYGRMNATLGVEVPFTNFLTQTTIPYGYADPPTEIFKDGETQVWKITHNGVDTHFMHFHLFTVQVINRVGWDGAIKPPDPNEFGFKDTVRMNPLEDVIVALRPFRQTVPFAVPNSYRPLLVTQPVNYQSTVYFTNIDPANNPATVTNSVINFGWEYVWHCHILGHEENDMMRAMILAVAPTAPTVVAATGQQKGTITLTMSASATAATPVPTGFTVLRATSPTGTFTSLGAVTASLNTAGTTLSATFTDTGLTSKTTYYYQVVSNNLVGYPAVYAAPAVGYPTASADSAATAANAVAK